MNRKTWLIFGVIVLAVVGGMVFLSMQGRLDVSDIPDSSLNSVIAPEKRNGEIAEHVVGAQNPKVTIVEYGDYQCPGCSTVAPEAKKLAEVYKDTVKLIFRNFPIPRLHPNARAAAAAAEAAGLQGKFWEMHDHLFSHRDEWINASVADRTKLFREYAEAIQLNLEQFDKDVASEKVSSKISFDVAIGVKHKVTGTPHVTVNGQAVDIKDSSSIETAVKDALKKAGVKVKDGTKVE